MISVPSIRRMADPVPIILLRQGHFEPFRAASHAIVPKEDALELTYLDANAGNQYLNI